MPDLAALADALEGRYRIEQELGRGGFAVVYRAHDLRHDRPVALKVLHAEVAAALGTERFEREIRLAARLQHPHILGVFDSGEAGGRLWFTMPFIEGESLRDRLDRERQLPVDEALRIASEVAGALDYAHRHDVIHRDIKPENILLSESHALVADFGIARAIGGAEGLTQTGMAIGTPAYMSPEQAGGDKAIDARSDVYALGCVLYEMLAGEPPFTGPSMQAIVARVLTETPKPLHPLRPAIPAALDDVIAKAMARVPADRFTGAADFARALAAASAAPAVVTGSGTAPVAAIPRPRRVPGAPAFAVFALGLLLGVGVLFAWRRGHTGDGDSKRVAVLPFENLGDAADEYFADGMTDEIRGKLAAISGLQVTARSSAVQYKKTTKTPGQIGDELGVAYLLTGTIRWEPGAGGTRRVRVSPELIQVSSGATRWTQAFDTTLSDVFQVQADIASRVARELDVAMGAGAQQRLSERPTTNPDAHQAFLRGEELSGAMNISDAAPLRRALAQYQLAVGLDSTFLLAWARIAQVEASLNSSGPTVAGVEHAREAAERAIALGPDRPEALLARGSYLLLLQKDYQGALDSYQRGLRSDPNDALLLTAAARAERVLGRWDSALVHLERSQRLDPRSLGTLRTLGFTFHDTRRYQEALATEDRALALAPQNLGIIQAKASTYLSLGDLPAARGVIHDALARGVDTTALLVRFAFFQEMMWVLPDTLQRRILTLQPAAFDGDRGHWGLKVGGTYKLLGDMVHARMFADSARLAFGEQLRAFPDNAQLHELLGRALALGGHREEAVREAELSLRMRETHLDASTGPYVRFQVARILVQAGELERALDLLEPLLTVPASDLTPARLRLDPSFAPLHGNPRYERMARGA